MEKTPNKSQHTKLTLEKKILPQLLLEFELRCDTAASHTGENTNCNNAVSYVHWHTPYHSLVSGVVLDKRFQQNQFCRHKVFCQSNLYDNIKM